MVELSSMLYELFLFLFVLITAITIHEFSHAWVAYKLGDPTAHYQGRVSLNPIKHLDPLGTLMIFIAHIGWGKPVPVNPTRFKDPLRDEAIVSFAGPFSNLLTALVASFPLKFISAHPFPMSGLIVDFLSLLIMFSVILFLFNLLPFKPLDGAAILTYFVPRQHVNKVQRFMDTYAGYFIGFILIDMWLLKPYTGFSFLETILFTPAMYIIHFIMAGA